MKKISILLLITFLAGCASIGPRVLKSDRYNYNLALANSARQELLLNIVRLRYDEGPMVIKVDNISASAKFDRSMSTTGSVIFPQTSLKNNVLTTSGFIDYTDNPIITYIPLDDKDYTTQFLQSLSLRHIALLLESSWSITRVFRLTLQELGTAGNATNAARSTSSHAPKYKNFLDVVDILRRMQLEDGYILSYTKEGKSGEESLILNIKPTYRFTSKEIRILQKNGIEIYKGKIIFSNRVGPHKAYMLTRSVLGISNYLSKGLVPPKVDVDKKVLASTYDRNGRLFNWGRVLNGMMKIYSSEKFPQNAGIAVPYRNRWFYIKDSDNESKQTLILVQNIVGLISTSQPGSDTIALSRIV